MSERAVVKTEEGKQQSENLGKKRNPLVDSI